MFNRINASIEKHGDKVRAITAKVLINSSAYPWKVADVQLQEGGVVTEYTEHVSEMERTGG